LYNGYVTTDARNICNVGAHVPTHNENVALMEYLAYNSSTIKEAGLNYWDTPNTGATNTNKLNLRGGGRRYYDTGIFELIKQRCQWWTSSPYYAGENQTGYCLYDSTTFTTQGLPLKFGLAIRLFKDSTTLTEGQSGTYVGNDGKLYRTICINGIEILADNLAETKWRDGSDITKITDNTAWKDATTSAYCAYNNDEGNTTYLFTDAPNDGLLYGRKDNEWVPGAELAGAIFTGEVKFLKTVEQPACSNTFSASKTIDFSLGNVQYMPITGDVSITLSNLREGVNILKLINDATAGRTVTIDSTFGTKTDNSATHSSAANKRNLYTIMKVASEVEHTIETSN
jgi:hypothetical protein